MAPPVGLCHHEVTVVFHIQKYGADLSRLTSGAPDSIPSLHSSTHYTPSASYDGRTGSALGCGRGQTQHPCPQVLPFFLCLVRFLSLSLKVPAVLLPRIPFFYQRGLALTSLFIPVSLERSPLLLFGYQCPTCNFSPADHPPRNRPHSKCVLYISGGVIPNLHSCTAHRSCQRLPYQLLPQARNQKQL